MTAADAAAGYLRRGWVVLPMHTATAGAGCTCPAGSSCGSPGKHPRLRWPAGAAPPTAHDVRGWWRRWPAAGVGILTGASGLLVVDVDPRHGGDETLRRVEADYGPLPVTLRSVTGGGGEHFVFTAVDGVRPSAGMLGAGVDIRAGRSLIVAPPSVHAAGRPYRWLDPETPVARPPAWLIRLVSPPPPTRSPAPPPLRVVAGGRYAAAALAGECANVRRATVGERNAVLNLAAFKLGGLIAAGAIEATEVGPALLAAALAAGLGDGEARATILSGLNGGARSPRSAVGA